MERDLFILVMRWVHILAAVVWVGGALFYALVLGPVRRLSPALATDSFYQAVGQEFRSWVSLAMGLLLVSGAALTVMRLTGGVASSYLMVLGVKVLLALLTFLLVRFQQRRGAPRHQSSPPAAPPETALAAGRNLLSRGNLALALALLAILLGDVLRFLVERQLQGG